jgi:outer membrane immunogenic protein
MKVTTACSLSARNHSGNLGDIMRSLLVVAMACAGFAGPALAADLEAKAPPPPGFSWTGFYIGGNVGGIFADTNATSGSVDPTAALGAVGTLPLASASPSSFEGGGQIGYNTQVGNWVGGVEISADAQRWKVTRTATSAPFAPLAAGDSFTETSNWSAAILFRGGYAWDHSLLYFSAGISWMNISVGTNLVAAAGIPAGAFSDNSTIAAGTIGGGYEYALTRNLSAAVEGRYAWYPEQTYTGGPNVTQTLSLRAGEVLGKLNWRF